MRRQPHHPKLSESMREDLAATLPTACKANLAPVERPKELAHPISHSCVLHWVAYGSFLIKVDSRVFFSVLEGIIESRRGRTSHPETTLKAHMSLLQTRGQSRNTSAYMMYESNIQHPTRKTLPPSPPQRPQTNPTNQTPYPI